MSTHEFDDDAPEQDLDDLEGLDDDLESLDEELDEDLEVIGEVLDEDLVEELDEDLAGVGASARGAVVTNEDEEDEEDEEDDEELDVLDLDEELHPDDVEAPLDALLQERTASATLEDEEDELDDEDVDVDDRGEGTTRIVPRRPGEFLCQSCFLVLPRHMLADEAQMLCRDCV